jgi:hypothetical protein
VAAYLDAYERFRAWAHGAFGGPADAPNMLAANAAAVLRYLKGRQAMLSPAHKLATRWDTVGRSIADTQPTAQLDDGTRERFWTWAKRVCEAADVDGLAFVAVKVSPAEDYVLLRRAIYGDDASDTPTGRPLDEDAGGDGERDFTDAENVERDGAEPDPADIYVDPSLETAAVKPKKPPAKKPPTAGDKFNTGLFLLAVIVVASIFHRR